MASPDAARAAVDEDRLARFQLSVSSIETSAVRPASPIDAHLRVGQARGLPGEDLLPDRVFSA